jgi:hypothetical protein
MTVCVPAISSSPNGKDFDHDGIAAYYWRGSANQRVVLGEDGRVAMQPGPEYCWAAGDVDDDGADRTLGQQPAVPLGQGSVTCLPGPTSKPNGKDFDGDGLTAYYWRGDNQEVLVDEAGSVSVRDGPQYCWLAGDTDDDGMQRGPKQPSLPIGRSTTICVPAGSSAANGKDYDRDGIPAYYWRGPDNVMLTVGEDGAVVTAAGPEYCWFAGDPDDDGAQRLPQQPPVPLGTSTSVCVPGGTSKPNGKDYDRDGVPAYYWRGPDQILVNIDAQGVVSTSDGPEYCWLAGDPDDDGTDRTAPPETPDGGDGFVALISPGQESAWTTNQFVWFGEDMEVYVDAYALQGETYGAYDGPLSLVMQRDCGPLETVAYIVTDCQQWGESFGGLIQPTAQTGNHYTFTVDAATLRQALGGMPAMGLHFFVQTGAGQDSHFNAAKEELVYYAPSLYQEMFVVADALEAGTFTPMMVVDQSGGSSEGSSATGALPAPVAWFANILGKLAGAF